MNDAVPSRWAKAPLAECADILDHARVPVNRKARAKRVGPYPYYGATGQVGFIDDYLFDEELVLLGEDGAPFLDKSKPIAYIVDGKCWVNNHAHVLRACSPVTSNRYLKYYFDSLDFHPYVNGTTRLKLTQAGMRGIQVPLPPAPEQHRIVAEIEKQFTRLDAAVAALKRVQANLKRYRASVLKAACEGRLVPTEAELARAEGRDYEPADQLLARILQQRRAQWEADQLAKMKASGKTPKDDSWKRKYKEPVPVESDPFRAKPEGWTWATWDQLSVRVTVGHVGPMKHRYVAKGVPFLRSQNVRENRFDPDGLLFIPTDFHQELSKSRLGPGDLVVVRSGDVGVTCVLPESLSEANCADLVIIKRPTKLDGRFGAYYMNSLAKRLIRSGRVGVALNHFNTKSVASLVVPVPPEAEQLRISNECERILTTIDEMETAVGVNLRRAGRLRQSILKQAFEGKLVPQDADDESDYTLPQRDRIAVG